MGLAKRMRKLGRGAGRRVVRFSGKVGVEVVCAEVGLCVAPGPAGYLAGMVAGHVVEKAVLTLNKKRKRTKG